MRSLLWAAVILGILSGAGTAGTVPEELHLIYTSDVRGTVGICG
ncbi:MAG: hypothetical protein AB1578_11860 [Thermodesulfobacteriota bacterium]|jgi:hypothetical protein